MWLIGASSQYPYEKTIDACHIHSLAQVVITHPLQRAVHRHVDVQSASLDGEALERAWLRHEEIARGGTLLLTMGDSPSSWGQDDRPPSVSSEE